MQAAGTVAGAAQAAKDTAAGYVAVAQEKAGEVLQVGGLSCAACIPRLFP